MDIIYKCNVIESHPEFGDEPREGYFNNDDVWVRVHIQQNEGVTYYIDWKNRVIKAGFTNRDNAIQFAKDFVKDLMTKDVMMVNQ